MSLIGDSHMIKQFFSHIVAFLQHALDKLPFSSFLIIWVSMTVLAAAVLALNCMLFALVLSAIIDGLHIPHPEFTDMVPVFSFFLRLIPGLLLSAFSLYFVGKDSWLMTRKKA